MPFTPFHFGPHGLVGLSLSKYIDLPVFISANLIIDLEPLAVLSLDLNYPIHGYFHTFLFGTLVGTIWAIASCYLKNIFMYIMEFIRLPYATGVKKIFISAILGIWLHIIFDAPIYLDIKPFYPSFSNPLYGIVSVSTDYIICLIFCIPALILYRYRVLNTGRISS